MDCCITELQIYQRIVGTQHEPTTAWGVRIQRCASGSARGGPAHHVDGHHAAADESGSSSYDEGYESGYSSSDVESDVSVDAEPGDVTRAIGIGLMARLNRSHHATRVGVDTTSERLTGEQSDFCGISCTERLWIDGDRPDESGTDVVTRRVYSGGSDTGRREGPLQTRLRRPFRSGTVLRTVDNDVQTSGWKQILTRSEQSLRNALLMRGEGGRHGWRRHVGTFGDALAATPSRSEDAQPWIQGGATIWHSCAANY